MAQRTGRNSSGHDRAAFAEQIADRRLKALYRLWEEKRAGRALPARRDFSPENLAPWLGDLYLMDVLPASNAEPPDFRFRLFGSNLARTYAIEPTGRLLSEVPALLKLNEAELRKLYADFVACARERLPCYDPRCAILADRPHVVAARLALPLSSDGETVDMLLVCAVPAQRQQAAA